MVICKVRSKDTCNVGLSSSVKIVVVDAAQCCLATVQQLQQWTDSSVLLRWSLQLLMLEMAKVQVSSCLRDTE